MHSKYLKPHNIIFEYIVAHFIEYSMCTHSGALKRFSGISAEHTIQILIVVYVITFLINLLYF